MSSIDDEALDWVAREPLNDAERAAFTTWYEAHPRHQGAYLRARAIAHSVAQLQVQASLKPEAAPPAPDEEAAQAGAEPPSRRRRALVFGGALAAGLAAVIVGPDLLGHTVFVTARGEFRKVQLADRSVVNINTGSQVEVKLTDAQRRVMLDHGEAWFEVAKDAARPFIVEAGDVRVRAVGTAFSVRRLDHGAEVLVTEGVVEVWANGGTPGRKKLVAGDLALVPADGSPPQVSTNPHEVERRLAWREGKLVFNNDPLAAAVAEFNRYNARQIVVADPALARRTLVGHYRIDQPEEFANDVHALLRVPVAIGAETIRIGARR